MRERKFFLLLCLLWLLLLSGGIALGIWWLVGLILLSWKPVFDRSGKPFLPVLMYHSVSDHYHRFPKSKLAVSLRNFRWAMGWLRLRGYRTLTFAEAEAWTRGEPFPRRSILLTFDDGYLDNWVNVWPLLRENGQRGTVFVTSEFIEPGGHVRPVRTTTDGDQLLDEWGFLSEGEIREADRSGVLEFLPHGRTHTWYPYEDRLEGFHLPGDRQVWLDWNLRPESKPAWIMDFPQGFAGPGWPVLAFGKSLEVKRFIVNDALLEDFTREVAEIGLSLDAASLSAHWHDFRRRHPVIGRMEDEDECRARLHGELEAAKTRLEALLGKPCDYFCWPGGGKQPESLRLAYEELGYRMTTTSQMGTPNRPNVPSRWLYRVGGGYSTRFENSLVNLATFISHVETNRRNYMWIWLYALCHAGEILASRLGRQNRPGDREPAPLGIPLS